MRRDNEPLSTSTLDVVRFDNESELHVRENNEDESGISLLATAATRTAADVNVDSQERNNDNFWLIHETIEEFSPADNNYEWSCQSDSSCSVDDPTQESSPAGLSRYVDRLCGSQRVDEPLGRFINDPRSRDEFINNNNNNNNRNNNNNNNNNNHDEAIASDGINQLDSRKNTEQKIFYEKPKLNIQTVNYLYEKVLPTTEKCIDYVNGIIDLRSVERKRRMSGTTENRRDDRERADTFENEPNCESVEFVELATSVKETLRFAEIEDIGDSIESSSETSDLQSEKIILDDIDLIREAKEKRSRSSSTTPTTNGKLEEIDLLSSIARDIGVDLEKYVQPPIPDVIAMETIGIRASRTTDDDQTVAVFDKEESSAIRHDTNKLVDQRSLMLPDVSSAPDARKKEKMARNQARRSRQQQQQQQKIVSNRTNGHQNRRPDKRRAGGDTTADSATGCFDVYNIETAMPKIDLDAIESHLRAAREEERRRRNDREEIRRRLAMGPDADDFRAERGRKPSLQSRLQSGMNLQICFMNETPSDTESPGSEKNDSSSLSSSKLHLHSNKSAASRPQVLNLPPLRLDAESSSSSSSSSSLVGGPTSIDNPADFFARQARLQTEARMALAQAKEMAHMQMEVERQRLKQSPITEMVRSSLEKVGVELGEDRRRLSRVLLTELNVAQLQVVANDLHATIAMLNEALVQGLLRRDDLHMEQDSMLVDVEDLTRYLNK